CEQAPAEEAGRPSSSADVLLKQVTPEFPAPHSRMVCRPEGCRRRDRNAGGHHRKPVCRSDNVSWQDCNAFNLDPGSIVQKALNLDQNHRWKMFAHAGAIT